MPISLSIVIGVFIWVGIQQDQSAKIAREALGDQKGEEFLAMFDTKQDPPDPKDVERYAKVLDELGGKCLETREEITVMAFGLTKSSIGAGFEDPNNFEANLNSLKTISAIADGFTDSRGRPSKGFCIPEIQQMITDNKSAAAENKQYEAEEKEAEEARKRQEEREKSSQ